MLIYILSRVYLEEKLFRAVKVQICVYIWINAAHASVGQGVNVHEDILVVVPSLLRRCICTCKPTPEYVSTSYVYLLCFVHLLTFAQGAIGSKFDILKYATSKDRHDSMFSTEKGRDKQIEADLYMHRPIHHVCIHSIYNVLFIFVYMQRI